MSCSPLSLSQPLPDPQRAPHLIHKTNGFGHQCRSQRGPAWPSTATDPTSYSPYDDPELMQLLSMKTIVIHGPQTIPPELCAADGSTVDPGRSDHDQTATASYATLNEQQPPMARSQVLGYFPSASCLQASMSVQSPGSSR